MKATKEKSIQRAYLQMRKIERKIRRANAEIRILDRKMDILSIRYRRAVTDGRKAFRYSYRIQLATLEGVRQAFCEYSWEKLGEWGRIINKVQNDM
jgi:hypothetical protein